MNELMKTAIENDGHNLAVQSISAFFSCGTVQAEDFLKTIMAGDIPGLSFQQSVAKVSPSDVTEIIEHLNQKTGKNFMPKAQAHRNVITARLREGYSKTDLITVVDNMSAAWGHDSKWSKFLRPSTLFQASKCDNYLNWFAGSPEKKKNLFDDLE